MRRELRRRLEALEQREVLDIGPLRILMLYDVDADDIIGLSVNDSFSRSPGESLEQLAARVRAAEPQAMIAIAEYSEETLARPDAAEQAARAAIATYERAPNVVPFKRVGVSDVQ